MRWERVGGETVHRGSVFEVRRDRVRIVADGSPRETEYDVVRHPGAAAVVALFPDGAVCLLHQFRYPVGRSIQEIPAGTLREGESFEACALRELEEETGWRAGRWSELARFWTTPGFCDEEMRCFLAEGLEPGEIAHDDDEHLEVERVPLAEALERIRAGEIADAKTIVALLATRDRLREEARWPPGEAR